MSSTNPQCVFINRKDVIELEKDGNICDSKTGAMPTLSKYKIDNVFDHLPISHPEAGIYRLTPPEVFMYLAMGFTLISSKSSMTSLERTVLERQRRKKSRPFTM